MVKTRRIRILSAIITAVLVTGTACPVFAASGITKEETVYAVADNSLSIEKIIVSEWLKNNDNRKTITDKSILKDIENVKGDETFEQNGTVVKWNANGNDIYYRGTSDKQLPVKMKASYVLNGAYINPDEIKGQKGDIEIHINYEASASPFTAITGVMLDGDKFSNVKVNSGQVINSGDDYYIVGIAFPGMEDITAGLGVDISDEIIISAHTSDFTYETMVTVLSNEPLKDLSGDFRTLTDLQSSVDELVNSSQLLTDGAAQLADGISTVSEKFGIVDESVIKLENGVTEIDKNMKTLKTGLADIFKGTSELYSGMTELQTNLEATYEGADELVAGINMISPDDITKQTSGIGQIYTGLQGIDAGLETLYNTMTDINSKEAEIIKQLSQISDAYRQAGIDTTDLDNVIGGLEQTNSGQSMVIKNLDKTSEIRTGTAQLAEGVKNTSDNIAVSVKQLKDGSIKLQKALKAEAEGAKTLAGYTKEINDGIGEVYNGVNKLAAGTGELKTGTAQLATGTGKLDKGITQIESGAVELSTGMNKFNDEGIGSIADMYNRIARNAVDKINRKLTEARNYKNYAGVPDNTETSVKFIIRSEGI